MNKPVLPKGSLLNSFGYAFQGLKTLILHERNFKIHIVVAIVAIVCCIFFRVHVSEWIFVLLLIGLVLCLEAVNTAIECICDFISPGYDERIKRIKDIASGAVLIAAIIAVIIGCIIFIPYFFQYLNI